MSQPDRSSFGAAFRSARLLTIAWISLLFFRTLLSVAGYGIAKRVLRNNDNVPPASPAFAWRVGQAINRASRFAPGATCLVRAMAGKFLLDRKSFASSICVGVARDAGSPLTAHAWLKSGDIVIVGDEKRELARYTPLAKSC